MTKFQGMDWSRLTYRQVKAQLEGDRQRQYDDWRAAPIPKAPSAKEGK